MNILRTLVAVVLLVVCSTAAKASTVVGNILDLTGSSADGVILFHPTRPMVSGTNYIAQLDRYIKTTNGVFTLPMLANDYLVSVPGRGVDQVAMSVPNNSATYNWVDLITSPITYIYTTPLRNLTNLVLQTGSFLSIATNVSGTNLTITLSVTGVPAHTHAGTDITSGPIQTAYLQPPGSDGQLILNTGGVFATDTNLVWSASSKTLTVPKLLTTSLSVLGTLAPPATASDVGTPGQLTSDGSFFYFCTATNTWKRWSISTW